MNRITSWAVKVSQSREVRKVLASVRNRHSERECNAEVSRLVKRWIRMNVGAYLPPAALTIAVERNGAGECNLPCAPAFHVWGQGIFTRFSVKETDAILLSSQDNRRGHGKTGKHTIRLTRPRTPLRVFHKVVTRRFSCH